VNSLAFLEPEAQSACARTPMERLAREAGARFEQRNGWNIAIGYGDAESERDRIERTVAFADRSSIRKVELQARSEVIGALALQPGLAEQRGGAWWCPVMPARVLVLGATAGAIRDQQTGTVVDLTCGLAALSLIGPGARELLARFCAIDVRDEVMPIGGFRPGSVARTPGYVLREAADRLLVMAGWAMGEYLWRVVADAAEHLGGGPVGADAFEGHASA